MEKTLSTTLQEIKGALNLTQVQLAEAMGVKLDRVKSLTSGKVSKLTQAETKLLVENLHVNPGWLATGNGDMFQARQTKQELAILSKMAFGDAPARHAENPNADFENRLKRVAFATQTSARIYEEFGFVPSTDGIGLLQMLLFNHGLDEAGARLIVEYMKRHEK